MTNDIGLVDGSIICSDVINGLRQLLTLMRGSDQLLLRIMTLKHLKPIHNLLLSPGNEPLVGIFC